MIGKSLGHYQITEKLGEGGMGVVYKARDTHLDRFVAIKILPPERVADPERKLRFVQEAKAASALSHPNIVTTHDITQEGGTDFIVMEYVAGKTLDDLIPRKGLRIPLALKYAVQIADGLARAHGAGIIHRDLKPSNVMVDEYGLVKVLDFGLAKLTEAAGPETETAATRTGEGTIIGTAAYMSPEQAEGRPVDARSDIFSFGSLLYEMVTGRRAFQGDSKVTTLAAIIKEEPAPMAPEIPYDLQKLITRCLRKDPERRVQFMKDLKVELEELKEDSDSGKLKMSEAGMAAAVKRPRWLILVSALVCLVLAVGWYLARPRRESFGPPVSVVPLTTYRGSESSPSFSPDGTQVAFRWSDSDEPGVFVKVVDGAGDPLRLAPGGFSPGWSPDGRNIAFVRPENDSTDLVLISPLGGAERKLVNLNLQSAPYWERLLATAWTPDSAHLVASARREGGQIALALVSAATGEVKPIQYATDPRWMDGLPAVSPDGRRIVFRRYAASGTSELFVMPAESGIPRRRVTADFVIFGVVWTPDGKELIYGSGQALYRIGADAADGSIPEQVTGIGEGGFEPVFAGPGFRGGVRMAFGG